MKCYHNIQALLQGYFHNFLLAHSNLSVVIQLLFFKHLNATWTSLSIFILRSTHYFRIHPVRPPKHHHLLRTVCSDFQFLHVTHTDIFLRIVATMLDAQLFLQPQRVPHTEETNTSNQRQQEVCVSRVNTVIRWHLLFIVHTAQWCKTHRY
jgi:hypothetical protein